MKEKILTKYLLGFKGPDELKCTEQLSRIEINELLDNSAFIESLKRKTKMYIKYRGTQEYIDLKIEELKVNDKKIELSEYLNSKSREQIKIIEYNFLKAKREFRLKTTDKIKLFFKALNERLLRKNK